MAKAKAEKVTKADAVRAAIKDGLNDNTEIQSYAKDKFGLDVSTDQISTYKSLDKKRAQKSAGVQKAAAKTTGAPKVEQSGGVGNGNGSPAALALAVKQLVAQHGAQAVADMAKVFEG